MKFVSELTHEHFIQCASYVVAMGKKKGILWNTRDNTLYEITVPNKTLFMDAVTNAITKGAIKKYYRNLLGGLYRENPVKSRNYEAVKSSKKWENVGNSYIIPALLLYRYSYI